ncbi:MULTISPECIES: hypothetical protein [unclassified Chryseobacterium]|uniref:hypothetical protein n=1 Tax=unclassified Chryseobacterium TaxID=2593645 RepID=UPI002269EBFB|nr:MULTISPECIES: hypothetical protein [unclassified Chryseobacterium]
MKKNIITILFLGLISCKQEKKETIKDENIASSESFQIPDSLSKNSIFIEKNKDGIFRLRVQSKEQRGNYFFADTANILKAEQYRFENNHFIKTKSVDLEKTEWSYFEIDSTNITFKQLNSKNYFLVSANTTNMGKAVPNQIVQFWAINKNDVKENYNLLYSGYPSEFCNECIKGDFAENEKLNINKSVKNLLYQFAKNSKLIYHPKLSEKNPNNYKNYQEKWETDNGQDSHFGAGYIGELDKIYSTYYQKDLFSILGTPEMTIENDQYLVGTYFRGNLLAYDKKKKLYFPVIVESCAGFCNKKIEFVNDHTLKITYEDDSSFEINLNKIIFDT